jgi:hypothetical protein
MKEIEIKEIEGISPENCEFSSASLSGTDIALPNSLHFPGMSKDALGRADQLGTPGVLSSQANDDGSGVGQGDLPGDG